MRKSRKNTRSDFLTSWYQKSYFTRVGCFEKTLLKPGQVGCPDGHDLTGEEIKDLMKRARITCAALAESLGVTGGVIRKARKNGLPGSERERWLEAIGPVPDVVPFRKPRRRLVQIVSKAACALFAMLISLLYGNGQS